MSQVLFTSDTHINHKNICSYRSEFKTPEEHDLFMINKILELPKRTVLYIIGDFLFKGPKYKEYIEMLSKKKCRIKLIMGNHDSLDLYKEDIFEIQLPLFCYKGYWISHAPLHPDELRGRQGCIHGHLHKERVQRTTFLGIRREDERYINVNIDVNNYEFVKFSDIKI